MAGEDLNIKPIKISIILPTNAYFMSGIRDFIMSFIKNTTKFPEQWAFRFQSIVDELCNNAIEYGSTPGNDIRLTLIYTQGESMEIEVEDSGTGKEKKTAAQLQAIVDEKRKPGYVYSGIRGRGLSGIVFGWSDEVIFKDMPNGGIMVIAKKKLTAEEGGKSEPVGTNDPTHVILSV